MATVFIPSLMRDLTGGQERVDVPGSNVRQIVTNLDERFPGVRARLCEGDRLSPRVNVAVDGELSRLGLLERVGETSEVHFIPAISGGAGRNDTFVMHGGDFDGPGPGIDLDEAGLAEIMRQPWSARRG